MHITFLISYFYLLLLGVVMKRTISGVGINDAEYVTQIMETIGYVDGKQIQRRTWICPYYQTWKSMIDRCYSPKIQSKYPTYKGCTVCEEWKYFSNFKSWMETQDWEGKQLDKDLLFPGNKLYSPHTCVFLNQEINKFMTESDAKRGSLPIGVMFHEESGKYRSSINIGKGVTKFLGSFNTIQEAHDAWKAKKLELAKELVRDENDIRIKESLISRYLFYPSIS
jgi:hypothetical protein